MNKNSVFDDLSQMIDEITATKSVKSSLLKSLQKLSNNNLVIENRRRRVSRDLYECKLCEMSLCDNKQC